MASTLDSMHEPKATWGEHMQAYEREKRRVIDEGFLTAAMRLPRGQVQAQERTFDPLLQRFRDVETESRERHAEERERVAHLNRAQDIEMMRGTPFHIINHESKLEKLAPGLDPERLGGGQRLGTRARTNLPASGSVVPQSAVDYNILSNKPIHDHHWARPGERPRAKERSPRHRYVPAHLVKDFNIISNRYLKDHEDKAQRDARMNLLEGTHKHMKQNNYDPVSQQFIDPRQEEHSRTAEHARQLEAHFRWQAQQPPCMKGRESAFFNILSHDEHDKDMLAYLDGAQREKDQTRGNRYVKEAEWHAQDALGDSVEEARKLNRVAPERHEEIKRRGYDIIDNKTFGTGRKDKLFHEPLAEKRRSPWEKLDMRTKTPGAAPSSSGQILSSSQSVPTLKAAAELPATGANNTINAARTVKLGSSASSIASSKRKRMGESASAGSLAGRQPTPAAPSRAPPPPPIPGSPARGSAVYSSAQG